MCPGTISWQAVSGMDPKKGPGDVQLRARGPRRAGPISSQTGVAIPNDSDPMSTSLVCFTVFSTLRRHAAEAAGAADAAYGDASIASAAAAELPEVAAAARPAAAGAARRNTRLFLEYFFGIPRSGPPGIPFDESLYGVSRELQKSARRPARARIHITPSRPAIAYLCNREAVVMRHPAFLKRVIMKGTRGTCFGRRVIMGSGHYGGERLAMQSPTTPASHSATAYLPVRVSDSIPPSQGHRRVAEQHPAHDDVQSRK
eukprot:gene931-biopygen11173